MAERLAVVGTRSVTPEMGRFVTDKVVAALESGATIVSGGSTGVDYIAARAVYDQGLAGEQLELYLPLRMAAYIEGFWRRVEDGKATSEDVAPMVALLEQLHVESPAAIHDNTPFDELTAAAFHYRNRQIVERATGVLAVTRGASPGTNYTIAAAERAGKPVRAVDFS